MKHVEELKKMKNRKKEIQKERDRQDLLSMIEGATVAVAEDGTPCWENQQRCSCRGYSMLIVNWMKGRWKINKSRFRTIENAEFGGSD